MTSAASVVVASGTKTRALMCLAARLCDGDGQPRLADPAGPVSVTSRIARSSMPHDLVDVSSRPIRVVDATGSEGRRADAAGAGAVVGGSGDVTRRSLSRSARSSRTSRPSSRVCGKSIRVRALRADLVDHRGQLRLALGRRRLQVQQSRQRGPTGGTHPRAPRCPARPPSRSSASTSRRRRRDWAR